MSAYEIPLLPLGTLKADADYRLKQFRFVKGTATGVALAGAGEAAVGVLKNLPNIGEQASVETYGVTQIIYGDTVTRGQNVMCDANAAAVPHTGTNNCNGMALESGVAGDLGTILLASRNSSGKTVSYSTLCIPVDFTKIANGDIVTEFLPGFAGTIEKVDVIMTDPVTTAAKAADLNLEIDAVNVTGGVVALTSAACTPLGKVVEGAAITANNTFTNAQKISVEAANTVDFVEGKGVIVIVLSS